MSPEPTTAELMVLVRDLADRLRRVEEVQTSAPAQIAPDAKRLTRAQVARVLNCSIMSVHRYTVRGLLVKLPKGPKQRAAYYDPANVEALARSEDHAREWVANRKYVPLGKRSR